MTNLETEPSTLPPPTPLTPPPQRRWARSDDRILLGVAGGLGRALAIEPLVVRIAFVVLSLFSGVGILFYVATFLLLADSSTSQPPSTTRRLLGGVALLIAAQWLFSGDARLPNAGWVVAIGLLGAAAALWRGRAPVDEVAAPLVGEVQTNNDGASVSDRWSSLTRQHRDRPRPPRSPLGLLAVGAATAIGALVWLIGDNADDRGAWAFGSATVVLGAGLVVGAFAGRARWLIVPALATATAAVGAAALGFAGVGLDHRTGDRSEFVGPENTPAAIYRTGVGSFELILADRSNDVATEVQVGVGDLTVVVPDGARVQIDARIGVGEIDAFGTTRSGYRRTLHRDSDESGAHLIKLDLRVGVGRIDVRRASLSNDPFVILPASSPQFLPDIPPSQFFGDGSVLFTDGSIDFGDGRRIEADGSYQIPIIEQGRDGSVQLDNGAVIQADGTVVTPGGFVIRDQRVPSPSTVPITVAITPPGATTTVLPEVQP